MKIECKTENQKDRRKTRESIRGDPRESRGSNQEGGIYITRRGTSPPNLEQKTKNSIQKTG